MKKKTVAHAVNSLIDVNSSHGIFHNSALESVITSGKKTFRVVAINEETTTQERKAQNSTSPVFSTLSGGDFVIDPVRVCQSGQEPDPVQSDSTRSDPVARFDPIRSGPVRFDPGFANGHFRVNCQ